MEALCEGYEHFYNNSDTAPGYYQHPSNLQLGPLAFQYSRSVQQGYPRGPLMFSLILLDLMESIEVPFDIPFQSWYLDDGTVVESRSAVADLLNLLATQGPSFGLTINLKMCEVFWPSGDPSFPTFPKEVGRPLQISDNVELLGSPIFGSPKFFNNFADSLFDKVHLFTRLTTYFGRPWSLVTVQTF